MTTHFPRKLQNEFITAVQEGHVISVQLLLAAGARMDVPDQDGTYPIEHAVSGSHVEAAKILFAAGADVNFKNNGRSLFSHVGRLHRLDLREAEMFKTLLAAGLKLESSDVLETWGHILAQWGNTAMLRNWLALGGRVDRESEDGDLLIHRAAQEGHAEALVLLREFGADVESADKNGNRAIHCAAERGRLEAVECLLAAGASVDAENAFGYRPLHAAAKEGRLTVVKHLCASGADRAAKTHYGETPLILARAYGHEGVAGWLEGKEVAGVNA